MKEEFEILITKFLEGRLTTEEEKQLNDWLNDDPGHQKVADDYRMLWQQAGAATHYYLFDIEKALKATKRRMPSFARKSLFGPLSNIAAAVLALALITSGVLFYQGSNNRKASKMEVVMQEVTTAYGTRSKFQLPDSSTVYLNSGSRLLFPSVFSEGSRDVVLSGEAFFEVRKDVENPFIVKTGSLQVRVLGTAFNVQAYENGEEMSTTLVCGKVQLERVSGSRVTPYAELNPNERAVFNFNDRKLRISKEEDLEKYTAWKDGKLVFFNDPISVVANKLGNWYNVEVQVNNPKLKNYHFTATFTDEPIEQVLDLLSKSSPMHYKIQRAVKQDDNSYTKRIVILN